ncbi:MAG TPA: enolase C-terminal domain-like protein [Patescibacteria group bacterium]|nr:enolase C-terminal domain-like protein [Patescibacteria group bacterium]
MPQIKEIFATQIFNSKGNPTVKTTVILDDGTRASSSIPSGVAEGPHVALELRDHDQQKYHGLGMQKAIDNVNNVIAKSIVGMDSLAQAAVDRAMIEMDGTQNKEKLGANAILSVSQAIMKASATSLKMSTASYIRQFVPSASAPKMPVPIFNMIEGGKHAGNKLNFQGFLAVPATSKSYSEGLDVGVRVYQALADEMKERGMNPLVADEAAYSPEVGTNKAALTFLKNAIERSGLSFSLDVFMGIEIAGSSFYGNKDYNLVDRQAPYSTGDLIGFYQELLSEFSLIYIEDPLADADVEGWKKLHQAIGDKTLIAGDDIITTNPYMIETATQSNIINGVVIKPNQIGTVTEAIAVVEIARFKNLKVIVSGRSGETEDTFIADFAVGVGADYVKFGAPAHERMVKYNRLLTLDAEFRK